MIAACLLLLAPCQDLDALAGRLRQAVDRASHDELRAHAAARELVGMHGAAAMALRLELYDTKWDSYRGAFLRDLLYEGMRLAASAEENELLAEAAADPRRSEVLRTLCLQALESGAGAVPAEALLDRRFLKAPAPLRRAWQHTLGALLARGRLGDSEPKRTDERETALELLRKAAPGDGYALAGGVDATAQLEYWARRAEDPRDRALALRALAAQDPAAFARSGETAFLRGSPGERCAWLEAAVEQRVIEAAAGLVRSLRYAEEQELARWRADCGASLRALTGVGLGDSAAMWERWWSEAGAEWAATARDALRPSVSLGRSAPDATTARMFGLAVDSDAVVLLVDGSGSMTMNHIGELDCAQAAAREAARFLAALGDDARFEVGIIEPQPAVVFGELVRARRRAIDEAEDFLRRRAYRGTSALHEALEAAAATEGGADTVVLITDGGSSAGLHARPDYLLEAAARLHAETGLRIHTVQITGSERHGRFLRELAEQTGGRAVRAAE